MARRPARLDPLAHPPSTVARGLWKELGMRPRALTILMTMVLAIGLLAPAAAVAAEPEQEWIVTLSSAAQADGAPAMATMAGDLAEAAGGSAGHVYDAVLGGFSFTDDNFHRIAHAVRQALCNGLGWLAIPVPERM